MLHIFYHILVFFQGSFCKSSGPENSAYYVNLTFQHFLIRSHFGSIHFGSSSFCLKLVRSPRKSCRLAMAQRSEAGLWRDFLLGWPPATATDIKKEQGLATARAASAAAACVAAAAEAAAALDATPAALAVALAAQRAAALFSLSRRRRRGRRGGTTSTSSVSSSTGSTRASAATV